MLSRCEVNATDVEWRPGNVVGEGSFSTVYRGSYCGIDVAVKELKFKLSQVRYLLQEEHATSRNIFLVTKEEFDAPNAPAEAINSKKDIFHPADVPATVPGPWVATWGSSSTLVWLPNQ